MLKSRTAIITGTSGFIGRALVELLESLSWEVICVETIQSQTSVSPKSIVNRINQHEFNPAATTFFHVGADSNAAARDLSDLYHRNVELTVRYFEATSRNSIPTIFISSAAVYGNKLSNQPPSPYAESKILGEKLLGDFQLKFDWPAITFRLFNTYGSGEGKKGPMVSIPRKFIDSAREKGIIEVWEVPGKVTQSRDFISISDVVSILYDAAISGAIERGGTFDLGTGSSVDYLNVAELVSRYISTEILTVPFPVTQNINFYQLNTKAENLYTMTQSPEFRYISLEQGVKQYAERILSGDES